MIFFFFSSRRRHTRWNCDWSSDVCSSDLLIAWGNFEAAKAIVAPVPSRVPTVADPGIPKDVLEVPSIHLRKNGQWNQEISSHGAICIVASSYGAPTLAVSPKRASNED